MIFTSEQVSRGRPGKICDQSADAIAGEITSDHKPNFGTLANGWTCESVCI